MEKKFHIGKNGPAVCRAKKRCRLSNPDGSPALHFPSKAEANAAYERKLEEEFGVSSTVSLKAQTPPAEIQEALEKMLPEDTIAYSVQGSRLYGLATETSDWDFVAIKKSGKSTQDIQNEVDLRTISLGNFMESIKAGIPNDIFTLRGSGMVFVDESYAPLLRSIRFDTFSLYGRLKSESKSHIHRIFDGKTPHKVEKVFRTVARNTVHARKALKEQDGLLPSLNESEIEEVHRLTKEALQAFERGEPKERIFDLLELD